MKKWVPAAVVTPYFRPSALKTINVQPFSQKDKNRLRKGVYAYNKRYSKKRLKLRKRCRNLFVYPPNFRTPGSWLPKKFWLAARLWLSHFRPRVGAQAYKPRLVLCSLRSRWVKPPIFPIPPKPPLRYNYQLRKFETLYPPGLEKSSIRLAAMIRACSMKWTKEYPQQLRTLYTAASLLNIRRRQWQLFFRLWVEPLSLHPAQLRYLKRKVQRRVKWRLIFKLHIKRSRRVSLVAYRPRLKREVIKVWKGGLWLRRRRCPIIHYKTFLPTAFSTSKIAEFWREPLFNVYWGRRGSNFSALGLQRQVAEARRVVNIKRAVLQVQLLWNYGKRAFPRFFKRVLRQNKIWIADRLPLVKTALLAARFSLLKRYFSLVQRFCSAKSRTGRKFFRVKIHKTRLLRLTQRRYGFLNAKWIARKVVLKRKKFILRKRWGKKKVVGVFMKRVIRRFRWGRRWCWSRGKKYRLRLVIGPYLQRVLWDERRKMRQKKWQQALSLRKLVLKLRALKARRPIPFVGLAIFKKGTRLSSVKKKVQFRSFSRVLKYRVRYRRVAVRPRFVKLKSRYPKTRLGLGGAQLLPRVFVSLKKSRQLSRYGVKVKRKMRRKVKVQGRYNRRRVHRLRWKKRVNFITGRRTMRGVTRVYLQYLKNLYRPLRRLQRVLPLRLYKKRKRRGVSKKWKAWGIPKKKGKAMNFLKRGLLRVSRKLQNVFGFFYRHFRRNSPRYFVRWVNKAKSRLNMIKQFFYVTGQYFPWPVERRTRVYRWVAWDEKIEVPLRNWRHLVKMQVIITRLMRWLYLIKDLRFIWGQLSHHLRQAAGSGLPLIFYKKKIKIILRV